MSSSSLSITLAVTLNFLLSACLCLHSPLTKGPMAISYLPSLQLISMLVPVIPLKHRSDLIFPCFKTLNESLLPTESSPNSLQRAQALYTLIPGHTCSIPLLPSSTPKSPSAPGINSLHSLKIPLNFPIPYICYAALSTCVVLSSFLPFAFLLIFQDKIMWTYAFKNKYDSDHSMPSGTWSCPKICNRQSQPSRSISVVKPDWWQVLWGPVTFSQCGLPSDLRWSRWPSCLYSPSRVGHLLTYVSCKQT